MKNSCFNQKLKELRDDTEVFQSITTVQRQD